MSLSGDSQIRRGYLLDCWQYMPLLLTNLYRAWRTHTNTQKCCTLCKHLQCNTCKCLSITRWLVSDTPYYLFLKNLFTAVVQKINTFLGVIYTRLKGKVQSNWKRGQIESSWCSEQKMAVQSVTYSNPLLFRKSNSPIHSAKINNH